LTIRRLLLLLVFVGVGCAYAQTGDVLGSHDLSMGGSSHIQGSMSAACLYCHVPHSGGGPAALWGQTLSNQLYSTYVSKTAQNTTVQPPLGQDSSLCLSCHDGTVAVGQVTPYGPFIMTGTFPNTMGSQLQGSHPFSLQLPIKDAPSLVPSLASNGTTNDLTKSVQLIKGNIECSSCHNPHIQSTDKLSPNFLVRDNAKGAICLACHDPNPRTVNGHNNPLGLWSTGIHSTSGTLVNPAANLGAYPTVADLGCQSCHASHNAGGTGLLRRANEAACSPCHSGGNFLSPAPPDVLVEFAKQGAHPFTTNTGSHDPSEPVLLNQNRHATCADCHNAHAADHVPAFGPPPTLRVSQKDVAGISDVDGTTVLTPAINQFENCLRCHGTSTGKTTNRAVFGYLPTRLVSAVDPLDVIPQFSVTSPSSHPVMHDRNSVLPQPSLRTNMLNLDGGTPGRPMGSRIFCTDCHNSDDNREFGGTGASGPHGSTWAHILERRYEFSQAAAPGGPVINLFPNPDISVNGPYAMCAKCHDLNQVMNNTSFTGHANHINDGFSCSACHTGHGMGGVAASVSGERLVNFDVSVVAANGAVPISYSRVKNTCSLVCHGHPH
jgi:predicted CXXCH cytochrome family protein